MNLQAVTHGHGDKTENGGRGRKEDRTQAHSSCGHDSLQGRDPLGTALPHAVHQNDGVVDNDASQADYPHSGHDHAESQAAQQQSPHDTYDGQDNSVGVIARAYAEKNGPTTVQVIFIPGRSFNDGFYVTKTGDGTADIGYAGR